MFRRLRPRELEDFATELALEFSKHCPPDKLGKDARAIKLARAVDDLCNRAAAFQRDKQLGLYRKAKLGTAFKLQLVGSGYTKEFVDELTYTLLIKMSGK